jgi:hypothetical protein
LLEVHVLEMQPEITFVADVKHCEPCGNGWLVGCELVGTHLPI